MGNVGSGETIGPEDQCNITISQGEYVTDFCCKDLQGTYIWPLFYEAYYFSYQARAVIYFLILGWLFLGVAIIADIFMCAIEEITSQTRKVRIAKPKSVDEAKSKQRQSVTVSARPSGTNSKSGDNPMDDIEYEEIEVKIWNDTVANLTLMALGSSAPEIILACVEMVFNNFEAGALGPGTIVGSASFNLLVITALCIMGIPDGECRRIKRYTVFGVTALFSMFAYAWVYIVIIEITPGRIEAWEAVATFCFFPILVFVAYAADRKMLQFRWRPESTGHGDQLQVNKDTVQIEGLDDTLVPSNSTFNKLSSNQEMKEYIEKMHSANPGMDPDSMAKLLATKFNTETKKSRAWYRVNETRKFMGGEKIIHDNQIEAKIKELQSTVKQVMSNKKGHSTIEFDMVEYSILEGDGKVDLSILRTGDLSIPATIHYETIQGSATPDDDYIPADTDLTFNPGEAIKVITIIIIDDNDWEPDETFFVRLSLVPNNDEVNGEGLKIGNKKVAQVVILNDDEPGTFSFIEPSFLVRESCGKAQIPVKRENGCDGKVELHWKAIDMTAEALKDFSPAKGTIYYEHAQQSSHIELEIFNSHSTQKDLCFQIELSGVSEGGKIAANSRTVVTIVDDEEFSSLVKRVIAKTHINMTKNQLGKSSWLEQLHSTLNVNGGDVENASYFDYIMHILTFPFKAVFCIIPPAQLKGGVPCFFASLAMIGGMTFIINEMATTFGCLIGIEKLVTAITVVALGTSLPDLFASKTAAINEKYADDSVGNVTGSNSVNVFLGMGIPWLLAVCYKAGLKNPQPFLLDKENLKGFTFSIVVYAVCGILCLILLVLRRYMPVFGNAELGGTKVPKILSGCFLIFLWVIYIVLNVLKTTTNVFGDLFDPA